MEDLTQNEKLIINMVCCFVPQNNKYKQNKNKKRQAYCKTQRALVTSPLPGIL